MIAVELPSNPASNLHLSYYTIGNICLQIISKTINGLILCLSHLYPSRLRINGLGQKSNTDMLTSKVVAPIGGEYHSAFHYGKANLIPHNTAVVPLLFANGSLFN